MAYSGPSHSRSCWISNLLISAKAYTWSSFHLGTDFRFLWNIVSEPGPSSLGARMKKCRG